ncbi:MAG: NADPH:quinone oxidoreductase family protein [Alphaproteobacteria bacterium]|jgi:NADPH:quinone reductase|nr:NADPH:quinone oxidoreductase family protein [Rhodospirillaceae bacterium]MBT6511596.1 NADPH:quinone oxidoreductase family protein [Rhodospirillaceae bacterium]MBT7613163.1 NADPH:quinone oxidoreductase family protein [Rhodospirillaceae bacterium]MBT7649319.1 NADPH:quinone oxidoreductase family protein [Rhodospirillaceae bacterium]MDG2479909.1 NADPH:quinone oxidoreductase family protein [Alphaproteobacteria bacterium]
MKALVCHAWGGPETLVVEEVADPVAGADEVVIRVEGCGVNFADTLIIQGKYQVKPEHPFSPGMEVAGTIAAIGSDVRDIAVGDAVIGMSGVGGFAELVVCKARNVMSRPSAISGVTAAGIPIAFGTAHIGLEHRGQLKAGESLLVHGASGGVGLAAVEIGKAMGATVIATASSAEKLAIAKEHGADHVIDYTKGEFRQEVKDLTGGGADVIFDPVGGDIFDQSLRCIAWEGRLVVVGFAAGRIPQVPANILLVKNISVVGVHWSNYRERTPKLLRESFAKIFGWVESGALNPLVSKTYSLDEAVQAFADLTERRATGKVVVTP